MRQRRTLDGRKILQKQLKMIATIKKLLGMGPKVDLGEKIANNHLLRIGHAKRLCKIYAAGKWF